ncbi:MAG: ABC transporter permease [Prevotellaceae bacterium]|jgi:ABC-2 type transport system permease protein|nr:ABC transporter permease [Prevotellaceae bacterium]
MRTLRFLLKKEFKQIFRNRSIVALILFAPVMQLLILPLAANFEIKNINIAIVDHDRTTTSQKMIYKITSSGYFRLAACGDSYSEAARLVEKDKADLILEIPRDFQANLERENGQKLFIAVNAINGVKAGLGGAYLARIITDFNSDIRAEWITPTNVAAPEIDIAVSNRFNPHLDNDMFMVPGILVALVTIIGMFLCALNIVKEKETGTIEQINVTPIKKYMFILSKLIPFWIIGTIVFAIGFFGVAQLVYGIVPAGNVGVLFAYLSIYLLAAMGLGLLLSTFAETQQQVMSLAFLLVMIFMMMSGLFTPIDSMPRWARYISKCTPVTYFIDVVRMLVLKGSGNADLWRHFLIMFIFALSINTLAVLNYRKTS